MRLSVFMIGLICAAIPFAGYAQELVTDEVTIMKARVVEIVSESTETLPGLDVPQRRQMLRVEILEGEDAGAVVEVENDFSPLKEGQKFYLQHTESLVDGANYYSVGERDRIPALIVLTLLFIGVVVAFGGKQGIRGLLALIASFFFIGAFLLPGILEGYSPVLVSIAVASLIVLIGSYVTHGVNMTTTSAVVGMIATIALTGLLAYLSILWTGLQGWTGEEVTYLNLNTGGTLDLAGILLGGILIGLLGVLYDAAIGQAVSVEEISRAGTHLSRREVYARVVRIGREHVGALVNTLAIAYAGAALPLLLLFYGSADINLGPTLSRELFATEIVRMLVGSIGLVLAVPITTAVSVYILMRDEVRAETSSS